LEKTSKTMKSNCHPSTTMPAKPCPKVPHLHVIRSDSFKVRWEPSARYGQTEVAAQQGLLVLGFLCWQHALVVC